MDKIINAVAESEFERAVEKGLTNFPKHLSSKFIYDEKGDKLFQDIMAMPDYYLTECEFNILKNHQQDIANTFADVAGFDLIELGAGDGKKTKILLRYLSEHQFDFKYLPIDISQHILNDLVTALEEELPLVQVQAKQGSYFSVLEELAAYKTRKKVILVLGSNIGNLLHQDAIEFLRNIQKGMQDGDMLFMGFDQIKDPETILNAYNDQTGITAAFNKNILARINEELGGDFDLNSFKHWETYNPESGTAKSFLVSTKAQQVNVKKLNLQISFKAWESIHVEISQKYTDQVVEWLAEEAGLRIVKQFVGERGFYKNYIFQRQ